jgi:hypothetical protein
MRPNAAALLPVGHVIDPKVFIALDTGALFPRGYRLLGVLQWPDLDG